MKESVPNSIGMFTDENVIKIKSEAKYKYNNMLELQVAFYEGFLYFGICVWKDDGGIGFAPALKGASFKCEFKDNDSVRKFANRFLEKFFYIERDRKLESSIQEQVLNDFLQEIEKKRGL